MKETIFNIYINSKNIDDKNIYFFKIKFELIKFKYKNVFNLFLHHVYMCDDILTIQLYALFK